MIFGKKRDKGLIQDGPKFKVVKIGENGITEKDILIHDAHNPDDTSAYMLSRMTLPEYPVAMGILRAWQSPVYEDILYKQIREYKEKREVKCVDDLLTSGNVFKIG